jgi:hypothetical protein
MDQKVALQVVVPDVQVAQLAPVARFIFIHGQNLFLHGFNLFTYRYRCHRYKTKRSPTKNGVFSARLTPCCFLLVPAKFLRAHIFRFLAFLVGYHFL